MAIVDAPAAEVVVDADLVRRLVRAQHPDLGELPLCVVASGWDNVLVRLGEGLVVRLPRRAVAAELVVHEQRWLAELAPRLPLPIPVPVRVGLPGQGFPWGWSVCPWFDGESAAVAPLADPDAAATTLAGFLVGLHRPAPAAAPVNRFRGVPLVERDAIVRGYVDALGSEIDRAAVERCWTAACALPAYDGPPRWVHGDLHPGNLVVRDGALAAVVDFGDVTAGDPATDVAVAWMLFDAPTRARFRAALGGVDDVAWRRAAGNALAHGLASLARSADAPWLATVGRRTITAVLAELR